MIGIFDLVYVCMFACACVCARALVFTEPSPRPIFRQSQTPAILCMHTLKSCGTCNLLARTPPDHPLPPEHLAYHIDRRFHRYTLARYSLMDVHRRCMLVRDFCVGMEMNTVGATHLMHATHLQCGNAYGFVFARAEYRGHGRWAQRDSNDSVYSG